MEKIYEEDQQQQKKKKQSKKKIKIDGVTMLSFAVALFAIVSLIAAGVSGFSYAAPTPTVYGEEFTGQSGVELFQDDGDTTVANAGMLTLEYHYATVGGNTVPLFCLQRDVDFGTSKTYKNSSNSGTTDKGLYYILSKIAVEGASWDLNGITITNNDASHSITPAEVQYWAGQAAIWYYLNGSTGNTRNQTLTNGLKNVTVVSTQDSSDTNHFTNLSGASYFKANTAGAKLFDTIKVGGMTLSTLVANAQNPSANTVSFSIGLSDGEGTISTDNEKQYYFSPLYTVTPVISDPNLGNFINYSISITSKDKEGNDVNVDAVITKKGTGEPVENTSALTINQLNEFYVRVPINKITTTVDIGVNIVGNFQAYDGLVYTTTDNKQQVAALRFVNKSKSTGKTFELAPSDDTGISAGQTIYFIGLIVLLCGVGIIYANAKPAKAQN